MSWFQRFIQKIKDEPAVTIGILGTAILEALRSLAGNGVISTDLVATWSSLVGSLASPGPIVLFLAAIITRFFVSPAKHPGL